MRELIRKTKSLTNKPFGVGIILEFSHKENVKAILEEKVALLQVSWGEYPKELVSEAHQAGAMVIHQVSYILTTEDFLDESLPVLPWKAMLFASCNICHPVESIFLFCYRGH